ncbi:MAG: sialate O-acetylesterase [Bacteroides sp.]|nr:sialate O-acetylesterase [Bacteroides sp.]
MNRLLRTFLVCFLFHYLGGLFPLRAEIRLPAIIDSGMVLRQNAFVPVWGKATPSEEVTITTEWSIQKYRTRADSEGNWQVKIRTASAGGPYTICFEGENRIELSDILLGEVWLASGQSNMEWRMQKARDAEVEIAQADHPQIRLFKVNHIIADTPQEDFPAGKAQWKLCTPENVPPFSCMAYHFATNLQRELQVPVGIIDASWGGTSVDSWTSNIYMQEVPELSGVYDRWKEWERDTTTSASRYMHARPHRRPGVLFNGMIHPVIPFAISGCIWYQGSSNKEWSGEYFDQLRTLLRCWRSEWDQGDFPFLIQQLCVYQSTGESGEDKSVIREHQLNMQQFNKVYVGSALDLGDLKDIHPTDKREFGRRFANMALNKVYGRTEIPAFGPQYRSHKRVRNAIRITFDHGRSLHHTGTRINHLYIAGDDQIFCEASYRIEKNRLFVWSPEVDRPVTVRYMWSGVGFGNLFNEAGLPASAFRLDN